MKQSAPYFLHLDEVQRHGWSCACVHCGRLYMDRGGDEAEWSCRGCGSDVRRLVGVMWRAHYAHTDGTESGT